VANFFCLHISIVKSDKFLGLSGGPCTTGRWPWTTMQCGLSKFESRLKHVIGGPLAMGYLGFEVRLAVH